MSINSIPKIKLLGSISNIYWSPIFGFLKNELDISGSVVYSVKETISSSIGFIGMNRKYVDYSEYNDKYRNDFFITAGVTIKPGKLNIDFSLTDGHLFKNVRRKQTIFNTNISYNF